MGKLKGRQAGASLDPENSAQEQPQTPTDDPLQKQFDKVLEAIADTKATLHQDINTVAVGLGLLREEHKKLRVKEMESTITELVPAHKALEQQVGALTDRVGQLERKAEDAEGRNRRNHVRVLGLPEGTEEGDMVAFLENWLKTVVAPEGLSSFFTLERAHRVTAKPLAPGRPQRPVVASLLHFRDGDLLLQKARTDGPFTVGNSKVSLFPDYTLEVQ